MQVRKAPSIPLGTLWYWWICVPIWDPTFARVTMKLESEQKTSREVRTHKNTSEEELFSLKKRRPCFQILEEQFQTR
jgi:hypothetical protein